MIKIILKIVLVPLFLVLIPIDYLFLIIGKKYREPLYYIIAKW